MNTVDTKFSPRKVAGRSLGAVGAALLVAALAVSAAASIRMDGSEFQGASLVGTTTTKTKALSGAKRSAVIPVRIVATFSQPLMGVGTMTPETSNGVAFKLGIGYEYNVRHTSYPERCACACAGDPYCDGVLDAADVVMLIDVAYRGRPVTLTNGCPLANTDVDCSGATNAIDAVRMIDVVFRAFPPETHFCNPCD